MRNLKRALSLALASVMLLGMMVVGSSAASFPDVDGNNNVEAVAVLNAVEVMIGNEKGEFEPDKNVTRNEMAVILAKLILGKDADKYVGTCPFNDVPEWAQKYVAACYDNKIVAGRTESVYDGNAIVTAQEAAAMTLRVLGYEKLESTGTNWAQPVVAKANEIRLFADVGSSATAPLNRDQVAQLALNALEATMVTSDVEKDIVIDGVVTIPGKVTYTERTTNKFDYTQSSGAYKKDVSDEKLQLCESLYEKDLRLVAGTDDFGRPATIWSYKSDELVQCADSADASYVKAVAIEDLYSDLNLKKTTTASLVVDGGTPADFTLNKTGTAKIGGNGVVVDAYKDDEGNVTIAVINPYVGEIAKVTEAKDDAARTVTVDGKKFETEAFEEDDVVVYTMAKNEIKTMYLAEVVENVEVSQTKGTSEFVADGKTYKYAASWDGDKTDLVSDSDKKDVKTENKLDLYLDAEGYVVKVAVNEGVTDYAYVLEIGEDTARFGSDFYAKLLLTDGTTVEAKLDEDDYPDADTTADDGKSVTKEQMSTYLAGRIVEYSKNSKDVYKLDRMKDDKDAEIAAAKKTPLAKDGDKIVIDSGKAAMTLGAAGTVYADSKTIFLTEDGNDNYKAYIGYDSVPNMTASYNKDAEEGKQAAYAYYCESGSVADVVYVFNASESTDDIIFLLGTECSAEIKITDGDNYFECPAVVNGEIMDVKLNQKITDIKLLKSIVWANEDEEIIDVRANKSKDYDTKDKDEDDYYFKDTVSKKLTNNNLTMDKNGSIRVADDAQVFVYSDEINGSSATAIGEKDTGWFVVNDGKIVTIFYKEFEEAKTDDEEEEKPGTPAGDIYVDLDNLGAIVVYTTKDSLTTPEGAEAILAALKEAGYTVPADGETGAPEIDSSGDLVGKVKKGGMTYNIKWTVNTNTQKEGVAATLDDKPIIVKKSGTIKDATGAGSDPTQFVRYHADGTEAWTYVAENDTTAVTTDMVIETGWYQVKVDNAVVTDGELNLKDSGIVTADDKNTYAKGTSTIEKASDDKGNGVSVEVTSKDDAYFAYGTSFADLYKAQELATDTGVVTIKAVDQVKFTIYDDSVSGKGAKTEVPVTYNETAANLSGTIDKSNKGTMMYVGDKTGKAVVISDKVAADGDKTFYIGYVKVSAITTATNLGHTITLKDSAGKDLAKDAILKNGDKVTGRVTIAASGDGVTDLDAADTITFGKSTIKNYSGDSSTLTTTGGTQAEGDFTASSGALVIPASTTAVSGYVEVEYTIDGTDPSFTIEIAKNN